MKIPQFLSSCIELFFPRICPVCGDGLVSGESILCVPCLFNLPRTNYHDDPLNKTCELFAGRVPFKNATSLFFYSRHSKYTGLIHELKYNGKQEIGTYLGAILGHELRKAGFCNGIDIIVPVPLHRRRLLSRGYNQSELIAMGISQATGIPVDTSSVKRVVNTSTQTSKGKEQRASNMSDVFEIVAGKNLTNKHLLLVDDVITTGATIESLARSVENIPGIQISIASLCVATS